MIKTRNGLHLRQRDCEIFEVTPVLLGGDPVALENKVMLTREEHVAAVRYWNEIVLQLRGV